MTDEAAFWQTKVQVTDGADDGNENGVGARVGARVSDFVEIESEQDEDQVCGKAGLNILAGAEVNFLGFPFPDFNLTEIKAVLLEEIAKMPTKSAGEVAKMLGQCVGIPGIDAAVSGFNSVVDEAVGFIENAIPDFEVSFPKAQNLLKTPEACFNVWKDTLPKGATCGTYNVGCPR